MTFVVEIQQEIVNLSGLEVDGWNAVLETAVISTLTQQEIEPPAELSVLLTDDSQIQQGEGQLPKTPGPLDAGRAGGSSAHHSSQFGRLPPKFRAMAPANR